MLRKADRVREGEGEWGELMNPKPLASVFESISFLSDIFMPFHFPLFSVLFLGYHSPKLSAGGLLQCFARRGLCLCQPTITFPTERAKSFFFSPCFSDICSSLHSSFENQYSKLSRHYFWTITDARPCQKMWQHNFCFFVCHICKPPGLCWRHYICTLAVKSALSSKRLCYCLNANKVVLERSGKPDCCDYSCSSRSIQININELS